MNTLEKNIINLHGEAGRKWIYDLPDLVKNLSCQWQLINIHPVKNMSWNFVALAVQNTAPVVLKISFDKNLIQNEYRALKHFNGDGSIKVLDINAKHNALLLEQAIPGCLLKIHNQHNINTTIHIYSAIVSKLSKIKITDKNYTHVKEWCNIIDEIKSFDIPKYLTDKAKQLKYELLNTIQNEYLCHGDLHLENIIQHNSDWVCIDPKGVIGEIAFEASAFDLINEEEMKNQSTISDLVTSRVTKLSDSLDISAYRLLSWIFLRAIISAQWFIEDNGDPKKMLLLASSIYPLIN